MAPEDLAELIRLANEFADKQPGPQSELTRALTMVTIENAQQMAVNSRRLAAIQNLLFAAAGQVAANDVPGPYEAFDLTDIDGIQWTAAVREGEQPNVVELRRILTQALRDEQNPSDNPGS